VLFEMRTGTVWVARRRSRIIATVRLSTRKPWSIDTKYFGACSRPLYLTAMAIDPPLQRKGLGRLCLAAVTKIARRWPADAIRLDAYDAPAGASGFYS